MNPAPSRLMSLEQKGNAPGDLVQGGGGVLETNGAGMTDKPITKKQLVAFIDRLEHLGQEMKSFADDIKDVYAEVKGAGFDPKAVRAIVRRRKDPQKYAEHEALVESYIEALGWDKTPLGMAAGEGSKVMQ